MPLKILIVEDSEPERRALVTCCLHDPALARYRPRVFEAADGRAALEVLADSQPDLVITDLLMPRMDGFALCKAIRQAPGGADLALLAVTGIYRDDQATRTLRELDVDVLYKPLDPRRLMTAVLALVEQRARAFPAIAAGWSAAEASPAVEQRQAQSPPPPPPPPASPAPAPGENVPPVTARAAVPAALERPAPVASVSPAARSQNASSPEVAFDRACSGDLANVPLARLLVAAAHREATGALRVTSGRVCKVIFLRGGQPVFVDSNLRNETLGAYLVARQVIDEQQLGRAIRHARSNKRKLGQSLVELGLTDSATITSGLQAQTQLKIASALRWAAGAFSFAPGDDFSGRVPDCPAEPVQLVLTALKRFLGGEQLRGEQLGCRVQLTDEGRGFRPQIEAAFGVTLLGRCVDRGLALRRVLAQTGVDIASVRVQVSALLAAGLATLVADDPSPEADPGADSASPTIPPAFEGLAAPAIPPALDTTGHVRHDTFDNLLPVDRAALPPVRPPPQTTASPLDPLPATAVPDPGAGEDSGVIDLSQSCDPSLSFELELELEARDPDALPSRVAPGATPQSLPAVPEGTAPLTPGHAAGQRPPGAAAEPAAQDVSEPEAAAGAPDPLGRALKEVYENIHEKSYYELLGVAPSADDATVGRALRQLAHRFGADAPEAQRLSPEQQRQRSALEQRIAQASQVLLDPFTRRSYDERLAVADVQPLGSTHADSFGAELDFQDGQNRLRTGDLDGAVRAFARAIENNEEQPDYHAFHGWALFLQRGRGAGGALAARPHFARALEIAPDSVCAHELAARVERDARDHRAAADHLARALASGEPRIDLFDQLRDALSTLGDHIELERQYRLMVFRLRETDPGQTIPLWIDLAYLHHSKLEQPDAARIALDAASRLAGDDPRVRAARASLGYGEAAPWDQLLEHLRCRQLRTPADPGPLHELFALCRTEQRAELFDVAALLVGLGAATPEERQTYHRLRSSELSRAAGRLAPLIERIRNPDDEPLIAQIVALLAPALCACCPVTLEDVGSSELELLADIGLPRPFAGVVTYVAEQLGQPLPEIYLSSTVSSMAPMPVAVPRLLVGQALLDSQDEPAIAFAAARAIACLDQGRRHGHGRRARVLKTALIAAYSLCRPVDTAALDPEIERFRRAVTGSAEASALSELFDRLGSRQLNLSRWIRGLHRSSNRIGLLLCGDARVALDQLQEPDVLDLVGFSLDRAYRETRDALALTSRDRDGSRSRE